jgi:hypothetical protein
MTIVKNESETGITVTLEGESDLRDAVGIRTALLECLECGRPTAIWLEAVETVDLTLLQLIESARLTFSSAGVPLSVKAGELFRSSWNDAGFTPLEEAQ